MNIISQLIWTSCTILLLTNCQSNSANETTDESDCLLGTPVAILSDTMANVSNHSFEVTGQNSVEKASLSNQVQLEFLQSGCENITQEFRMYLPQGDYTQQHDTLWVQKAAETFWTLGGQNTDQQSEFFKRFGMMLQTYSSAVQFNEPLTLEHLLGQGMFFIMEKTGTANEGVISVEIFQRVE